MIVMMPTLVYQLVEGMLSVRPRFPPDDRSSAIVGKQAVTSDCLPVRFHVALK